MSSSYGVKELFNTLLQLDQDLRVAQHAAIEIPEANHGWPQCHREMGEAQQKLQHALDSLLEGARGIRDGRPAVAVITTQSDVSSYLKRDEVRAHNQMFLERGMAGTAHLDNDGRGDAA